MIVEEGWRHWLGIFGIQEMDWRDDESIEAF